jgi:hypothetical protein
MRIYRWMGALSALLLLGGALLAGVVLAQSPEQTYDLSWWTVDGGGGTSAAAGNYTLDGTAGQPDPGPVLSGEGYNLEGGFWGGGVSGVAMFNIYLPLVQRGS